MSDEIAEANRRIAQAFTIPAPRFGSPCALLSESDEAMVKLFENGIVNRLPGHVLHALAVRSESNMICKVHDRA